MGVNLNSFNANREKSSGQYDKDHKLEKAQLNRHSNRETGRYRIFFVKGDYLAKH
jgi:hypothetical protein